jgi:hypothetical protein
MKKPISVLWVVAVEEIISPEKPTGPDGFYKTVSYLEVKESLFVVK